MPPEGQKPSRTHPSNADRPYQAVSADRRIGRMSSHFHAQAITTPTFGSEVSLDLIAGQTFAKFP
jgi:hypothetical protein